MISVFLAAFALLAGYAVLCAVSPLHRCPRCEGTRVVARRGRFVPCLKCNARGRAYRFGAPLVHRLLHEHVGAAIRDRVRPVRDDEEKGP